MEFEEWIRAELASGTLPPIPAPTPPRQPRGLRGRGVQLMALVATFGVIGFGLASAGSIAPVRLQVEHSGDGGLPVNTWAGSPPAPSGPPRALQAEPAAAVHASPTPPGPRGAPAAGGPAQARAGEVVGAPVPAVSTAAPSAEDGHGGQPAPTPPPAGAGTASPTPTAEDGGGHGGDRGTRGGPSPSPGS